MSLQQPLEDAGQPAVSQLSASRGGTARQFAGRGLGLARSIWVILSARRSVRISVGIFLLLLGIAGLFLPILQGVATIIAALAILRKDIPLAERIWQRWVVPFKQRWVVPFEHHCQQWLRIFRQRRAGRRKDGSRDAGTRRRGDAGKGHG